MEKADLKKMLHNLCRNAYLEGRRHENDRAFTEKAIDYEGLTPDKGFEDTETFKMLERSYPK
jgi:hypothetical protein